MDQWQRPAALAGLWYPADAQALSSSVARQMAAYAVNLGGARPLAIITPHAGHRYSGELAGAAWSAAALAEPRTVVLLGPSHRAYLTVPSIWPQGAYDSPLGPVPVDRELAAKLSNILGARFNREAHLTEHCLEVQIPFIKKALPNAALVPILTPRADLESARKMGSLLAGAVKDQAVILAASTDLSHFHDRKRAKALDESVAQCVKTLDAEKLFELAGQGKAEACGLEALAMVLFAARELGAQKGQVLALADSSQAGGEESRVVGYMAAALLGGKAGAVGKEENQTPLFSFTREQKEKLLDLARRSVEAAVKGEAPPETPEADKALLEPLGVFVTLRVNGKLRGCLGRIRACPPLVKGVVAMARAAALDDPRFLPVRSEELDELQVEISVLTPFSPVKPEDVVVGRDGLYLEMDGQAGLLLPQVPGEMGWDQPAFLEAICRKAGLPTDSWLDSRARLFRFQAVVFP